MVPEKRKILVSSLLAIAAISWFSMWFVNSRSVRSAILAFFNKRLRVDIHVAQAEPGTDTTSNRVIYILSGNREVLVKRLTVGIRLLHAGAADRILMVNLPHMPGYGVGLGRGVPFKRWVVDHIGKAGIDHQKISFVDIKEGFWGTLTEAQNIKNVFSEDHRYRELILVSSHYHTRRSWLTFSRLLPRDVKIYVYAYEDEVRLRGLMIEMIKYFVYRYALL